MTRYKDILVRDYANGITQPHYMNFRLIFFVQKLIGTFDWRMNF